MDALFPNPSKHDRQVLMKIFKEEKFAQGKTYLSIFFFFFFFFFFFCNIDFTHKVIVYLML